MIHRWLTDATIYDWLFVLYVTVVFVVFGAVIIIKWREIWLMRKKFGKH